MYMGQRTVVELPIGQAARSGEGFKVGVDWSTVRIDVVSASVTDMNGIAQQYPVVDGSLSVPNRLALVGSMGALFDPPGLVMRLVKPIEQVELAREQTRLVEQTLATATKGNVERARSAGLLANTSRSVNSTSVGVVPFVVIDGRPSQGSTTRTIKLRIMYADTMERIATEFVEIDLEPVGCMDPAAKRTSCEGADGTNLAACLNARTTASNITDETTGTFANPQGNFDERVRVPLGGCKYPPVVAARGEPVSVAAPSFKRPEEVSNPEEVRGSFALAVPTGATGTQAALEATEPDETVKNMVNTAVS
jgi:hypothetical protein